MLRVTEKTEMLVTLLLLRLANFLPVDRYRPFQNPDLNCVSRCLLLSQCEHFLGQGKFFPV